MRTPLATGQDMVNSHMVPGVGGPAVAAGMGIPQHHSAAGGRGYTLGYMYVVTEPNDQRHRPLTIYRPYLVLAYRNLFGFVLHQHDQGTPYRNQAQWLITGIQNQHTPCGAKIVLPRPGRKRPKYILDAAFSIPRSLHMGCYEAYATCMARNSAKKRKVQVAAMPQVMARASGIRLK